LEKPKCPKKKKGAREMKKGNRVTKREQGIPKNGPNPKIIGEWKKKPSLPLKDLLRTKNGKPINK